MSVKIAANGKVYLSSKPVQENKVLNEPVIEEVDKELLIDKPVLKETQSVLSSKKEIAEENQLVEILDFEEVVETAKSKGKKKGKNNGNNS